MRVWQARHRSDHDPELVATLAGHAGSINCLAVCKGTSLIASGSADTTVKVWRLRMRDSRPNVEIVQTITPMPRFLPLSLSLHCLNADQDVVLTIAGTTNTVHVYVAAGGRIFNQQAVLAGHEGWICSLAITQDIGKRNSDYLLASASQDKYIRLWRITKSTNREQNAHSDLVETLEQSLSNKAHKLESPQHSYIITFEALLLGHEDWVYTVNWRNDSHRLRLLSASADNSLAMWESEASSGIWVCSTRLGEISSQKGSTAATGSIGGFWIGLYSPNGESVVSLERTGGWRLWKYDGLQQRWYQSIGVSGHTSAITDVAWSKDGSYLLSTSTDQTTRLHACWNDAGKRSWHEMARPQVHGYCLNCVATVHRTQFVSGAEEKLLRVFDEPRTTARLLNSLCGVKTELENNLPEMANIPMLGLSNKAIENPNHSHSAADIDGCYYAELSPTGLYDVQIQTSDVDHPPFEDNLARHTLWPEKEKLYGHGYEISAVAASYDGTIIATSCKASSPEHAAIRLYSTQDWQEIKPLLIAHSLTVTSLCFTTDDQFLLSVGRDRQWIVFERDSAERDRYFQKHVNLKSHSRMILDAAWVPSRAGRGFATASRDKSIKIWIYDQLRYECTATLPFESPVTTVDILPRVVGVDLVVAGGTEMGEVVLHIVQLSNWTVRNICRLRIP